MGRALALIAIIAVANANTCSNKAHAKFWPNWVSGSSTKFINSNSIECEFAKCPPLFLHRCKYLNIYPISVENLFVEKGSQIQNGCSTVLLIIKLLSWM